MNGTLSLLLSSYDGAPTSNEPGPAAVSLLRNKLKQQPHVMWSDKWIAPGFGTNYC